MSLPKISIHELKCNTMSMHVHVIKWNACSVLTPENNIEVWKYHTIKWKPINLYSLFWNFGYWKFAIKATNQIFCPFCFLHNVIVTVWSQPFLKTKTLFLLWLRLGIRKTSIMNYFKIWWRTSTGPPWTTTEISQTEPGSPFSLQLRLQKGPW
jgi:hypothetical protein